MGTRCGEILTLENIDAYAYACRGRCLTKEYFIKLMFSATDILVNIELCIIYMVLKASTLTLNKPLFR